MHWKNEQPVNARLSGNETSPTNLSENEDPQKYTVVFSVVSVIVLWLAEK